MQTLTLRDTLTIDGEVYYHYTFGGKYTATKWVTVDGINYYNSNRAPEVFLGT